MYSYRTTSSCLVLLPLASSYNVPAQVTLPWCRRCHRSWWNRYAIPIPCTRYICGDTSDPQSHSHQCSANIGIGAAVVRAFAAAGCERIAITDVNPSTLEQTRHAVASTHPTVQLFAHAGSIAEDRFAQSFIDHVVSNFGRIDYAVNCAGVLGFPRRSDETSIEEFDRVNNINYRGCWLSSRAQLKQMIAQEALPSHDPCRPPQRGAVVNISSQLGIVSRPNAREFASIVLPLVEIYILF